MVDLSKIVLVDDALRPIRREYNQAMGRELDRLLPSWVSEVDLPQLIFDDSGRFLGLGDVPEGREAVVYVPARAVIFKPPR